MLMIEGDGWWRGAKIRASPPPCGARALQSRLKYQAVSKPVEINPRETTRETARLLRQLNN
jgi:hypothetical protein